MRYHQVHSSTTKKDKHEIILSLDANQTNSQDKIGIDLVLRECQLYDLHTIGPDDKPPATYPYGNHQATKSTTCLGHLWLKRLFIELGTLHITAEFIQNTEDCFFTSTFRLYWVKLVRSPRMQTGV
jgi:hypothetical protein